MPSLNQIQPRRPESTHFGLNLVRPIARRRDGGPKRAIRSCVASPTTVSPERPRLGRSWSPLGYAGAVSAAFGRGGTARCKAATPGRPLRGRIGLATVSDVGTLKGVARVGLASRSALQGDLPARFGAGGNPIDPLARPHDLLRPRRRKTMSCRRGRGPNKPRAGRRCASSGSRSKRGCAGLRSPADPSWAAPHRAHRLAARGPSAPPVHTQPPRAPARPTTKRSARTPDDTCKPGRRGKRRPPRPRRVDRATSGRALRTETQPCRAPRTGRRRAGARSSGSRRSGGLDASAGASSSRAERLRPIGDRAQLFNRYPVRKIHATMPRQITRKPSVIARLTSTLTSEIP